MSIWANIPTIAVVIPYFQRSPGILKRALVSIASQRGCEFAVRVLVVDDASPVSPEEDIAGVQFPEHMSTTVLRRPNGGPGAARNTGLDALSTNVRYVAFLDSDDEWTPDHLARATAALECGFDFYFADHLQLGQSVGAFQRAGRIKPSEHPAINCGVADLHAYRGDMFDQVLRGNVVGTSTVVYRREGFSDLRFNVAYTTAGEDYLFWMALATRGARVAFSSNAEADYGRGVNVYSGSGWGTEGHLLRVQQEILYRKTVRSSFELNEMQEKYVGETLAKLRTAFLLDVLHRIRHRMGIPARILAKQLHADPATWLALPRLAIDLVLRRS